MKFKHLENEMMKMIMIIVFLILGQLIEKTQQRVYRRKRCFVLGNSAMCTKAPFIPPLPQNITKLTITRSVFHELTDKTFNNLTDNNISTLVMYMNGFKNISTGSFAIFNKVSDLEIYEESNLSVTDVKHSLSSLDVSYTRKLLFTKNSWTSLPVDMFLTFNTSSMNRISLDDNDFSVLNLSVFSPLKFLKILSCVRCNIVHINANGEVYISKLHLKDNKISEFPDFCPNIGIKQHLHYLDLSENALTALSPTKLGCLKDLRKLYLNRNPIKILRAYTFAKMLRLETLHLNHMQSLKTLQGRVFASKSLKYLSLRQSFHFFREETYQAKSVFDRMPNLSVIDLSINVLPNSKFIKIMFLHLKTINRLLLSNTRMEKIPEGFFQMMPELKEINLRQNRIVEWNSDVFFEIKKIEKLDLSHNLIKIINSTSFPKMFWENIKNLDLSDNPFSCTCDLKWFSDELKSENMTAKLKDWPGKYSCDSPKSLKRLHLEKYNPTTSECSPLGLFYIITIVVCSLVITFFFVLFGICQCQSNIKNLIYYVRLQMKGYWKIQSGSDFMYHVYVVYCEADRHWVHHNLLPKLELEGIIVCIHHRDFDIGKPIIENITDCINNSWKIVVVLSNKFAKSEWCLWELDLVQERRRRVGNDAVIVIVYKDIDSRHMTSRLRSLLMASSSLKYNNGIGKQMFWKAVIKNINKPLSLPPTSQL